MAANKKSSNSLYKNLFFLSVVLLVIIGVLYINKGGDKEANKEVEQLKEEMESQDKQIEILNEIFLAEEEWIDDNQLSKAIKKLESINKEYSSQKAKRRIRAFKKMQEQLAPDTVSTQQYEVSVRERNRTINQLNKKNDSLSGVVSDKLVQFQQKNDSLTDVIQKKQKALNRKENVQVITFNSPSGDEVHYLGEVKNGKANGGGVGIWRTGSIYRGQWKNNKRHGEGTFEWADGQKYEGDFKNDIRTGEGTYYWPSGERYEGDFKNNRREGKGTLYDPDGNTSYEGKWDDDEPVIN